MTTQQDIITAWNALDEDQRQRYREIVFEKTKLRGRSLESKAFSLYKQDFAELQKTAEYRKGPEGCIRWVEENVKFKVPVGDRFKWVYPPDLPDIPDKYGRSPASFWEEQKGIIREALAIDPATGLYKYKLIVLCWMRGESKSFIVVLMALYRFFCFPFQQIFFASNSKDQTDVVHFGVAKEIIQNSPRLIEITGPGGITENEIRIFSEGRGRFNTIQLLSTASGIVSNANVITQSEAFEMPDDTFFTKWSGSLRNTPNAIGLIDTTVSSKEHWLYTNLYLPALKNPGGKVYFSYRSSPKADPVDFWNPGMDERELAHFQDTFTSLEFGRYFKNLWDLSDHSLFSKEAILAVQYLGVDGQPGNYDQILQTIRYQEGLDESEEIMQKAFERGDGHDGYWEANPNQGAVGIERLMRVDDVFSLGRHSEPDGESIRSTSRWADMGDLDALTSLFSTYWALLVGVDRADPLKYKGRLQARTVISWELKGLVGSMGKPAAEINSSKLKYLYILMGVAVIENSSTAGMVEVLRRVKNNFSRIDMVTGENYGLGDVSPWCKDNEIPFRAYHPSKDRQRIGYTELITAVSTGRFKTPPVPIHGSKRSDIFMEEIENLDDVSGNMSQARVKPKGHHSPVPKYGSPKKYKKGGIQDDVMDTLCWAMYGGIDITAAHFKPREKIVLGNIGGIFGGMASVVQAMQGYCGKLPRRFGGG